MAPCRSRMGHTVRAYELLTWAREDTGLDLSLSPIEGVRSDVDETCWMVFLDGSEHNGPLTLHELAAFIQGVRTGANNGKCSCSR